MKKIISGLSAVAMLLTSAMFAPASTAADIPVLRADSVLMMTKDGTSVCGTGGTITASALAAEFDGKVTVKDPVGNVIDGDMKVPAGSTVTNDGGEMSVLISGDANADGSVNLTDVSAVLKKIAKWDVAVNEAAADPDNNTSVNLADASLILKYIAGWDVRLGYMKVIIDEEAQVAAAEDEGTVLWADHGTTKLERTEVISSDEYTYVINAAKNEAEGATVYISPDEDKTGITVSATDFINSYGETVETEVFTFYYHNMRDDGYMPDMLMPTDSTYEAKVSAGNSQGFYIKGTTTAETAAGLYESTVSIREGGAEIKKAKIYLNVWDFTLDDKDAPRSSFGLDKSMASLHGVSSDDPDGYNRIYKLYYDLLLENRICAYTLPYNAESDEADVYLNDPRMNSFVVYGTGYGGSMDATIDQLKARYEKMKDNPEWFEKAYFYCADEPYDAKNDIEISQGAPGVYADMKNAKALIDQYFPGGKQVVPLETGTHITLYDGFMELYRETTDILCPKTYAFVPQKYYGADLRNGGVWQFNNTELAREYGTYADYADKLLAENGNKESWWYFAGLPAEPLTTYHATADGMYVRMSGWQMFQEDVTGVLYYAVNDYRGMNPMQGFGMEYMTGVGVAAWGNGILVYSGARFGVDGPLGSVRIDYIRDSFEDYMYLRMAERTVGKEATDELVLKVTRDLVDFETDAAKMQAVRAEIAEAIMAGLAE